MLFQPVSTHTNARLPMILKVGLTEGWQMSSSHSGPRLLLSVSTNTMFTWLTRVGTDTIGKGALFFLFLTVGALMGGFSTEFLADRGFLDISLVSLLSLSY